MPLSSKSLGLFGIAMLAFWGCVPAEQPAADHPRPVLTEQPSPPSDSSEPKPAADECGAGKLGSYLNQLPTAEVMAKVRQTIGHDRIRTIRPGDAVTMDYRPDRLNNELGEDGRIKRLRCG